MNFSKKYKINISENKLSINLKQLILIKNLAKKYFFRDKCSLKRKLASL